MSKNKKIEPKPVSKVKSKDKDLKPESLLRIDPEVLMELRLLEAERRAAIAELKLKQAALKEYRAKVDPENVIDRMIGDIQLFNTKASEADQSYKKILAKQSEELGVDVTKFSYDPTTGVLFPVEGAVEGAVEEKK